MSFGLVPLVTVDHRGVAEDGEEGDVDDSLQRTPRVSDSDQNAGQMSGERSVGNEDLDDDQFRPTNPFRRNGDKTQHQVRGRRFGESSHDFHGEKNAAEADGATENVRVVFERFGQDPV